MFKEIAPIAKTTDLTFIVKTVGETDLSVILLPKTKEGAHEALSAPLVLTGSPEELDEKLPTILTEYCKERLSLEETLEETKAYMAAAKKDAEETAKKTVAKSASGKTTMTPPPAADESGAVEEEEESASPPSPTGDKKETVEIELF